MAEHAGYVIQFFRPFKLIRFQPFHAWIESEHMNIPYGTNQIEIFQKNAPSSS